MSLLRSPFLPSSILLSSLEQCRVPYTTRYSMAFHPFLYLSLSAAVQVCETRIHGRWRIYGGTERYKPKNMSDPIRRDKILPRYFSIVGSGGPGVASPRPLNPSPPWDGILSRNESIPPILFCQFFRSIEKSWIATRFHRWVQFEHVIGMERKGRGCSRDGWEMRFSVRGFLSRTPGDGYS